MIIPWLEGFASFRTAPVTWFLFALNLFIFSVTNPGITSADKDLQVHLGNTYYLESQAFVYAEFILASPAAYSVTLRQLAEHTIHGHVAQIELLGNLALRDEKFMSERSHFQSSDPIALKQVNRHITAIEKIQNIDPLYDFGLFAGQTHPLRWLTYIFTHSGLSHLLGNMFFLLLFGCYLERREGGALVLMVFLGTGVLAALAFLLMTGATLAPLVGASGAVSGLMGYFCARYFRAKIQFFYWLFLPGRKYSGLVYLPSWTLFILWCFADAAGYLASLGELGGVAYAAHLGGEVFGVILGCAMALLPMLQIYPFSKYSEFQS